MGRYQINLCYEDRWLNKTIFVRDFKKFKKAYISGKKIRYYNEIIDLSKLIKIEFEEMMYDD